MLNGQTIQLNKGKYKVVEPLASGGQGSIWKVKNIGDGQLYALKTVNRYDNSYHSRRVDISDDNLEKLIGYAQSEIDFLLSLDRAKQYHIVSCLDHGLIEADGYSLPTLVMPLFDNDDLAYRIEQIKRENINLSAEQWLKWFKQLIKALLYMQEANTQGTPPVHRDIKPKNCLLNQNDDLFLIDFGVVKASNLTGTSSVVFTYSYCAPEQRLAQYSDGKKQRFYITPAVDIYAVAIVMYEIVAGGIRAQEALNDDNLPVQHLSQYFSVKQGDGANPKKIGLLGKIGGLENKEKDYLKRQLKALLTPPNASDTIILKSQKALPNYDFIADGLVSLLQEMLSPWPDDRPSAVKVLESLNNIEQALQPELKQLAFTKPHYSIVSGKKVKLAINIEGKGLTAYAKWLEVMVDHKPIADPYFFAATNKNQIILELPAPNELGDKTVMVSTSVNKQHYQTECTVVILPTPEELWQMGQREEALTQKLDDSWLDEWENEVNTTTEKYKLSLALQRLREHHPRNEQLQARFKRVEGIVDEAEEVIQQKDPDPKPKIRSFIFYGLGSVFIVIMGMIVWNIVLFNESVDKMFVEKSADVVSNITEEPVSELKVSPEPEIPVVNVEDIKKTLLDGNEEEQQKAWLELGTWLKDNPQHPEIQTIINFKNQYEKDTVSWIKGEDKSKQKIAFKRLKAIAQDGKNAQHLLGQAYWKGLGTEIDYKQARFALKKAIEMGNKNAEKTLKSLENDPAS